MGLLEDIKKSEDDGFKSGGVVYKDTIGFDTIGYGTKLPLSEKECEILLKHRLDIVIDELLKSKPFINSLSETRKNVLFEMAYQLGVPKALKFKKMWLALENNDFNKAKEEMIDSIWYNQTPNRVLKLANNLI